METTKNVLEPNVKLFFNNLSEYLDVTLLYYGSIQRDDYIPGKSDIDILIFTDNEYSTISKMQHFLHVLKTDFKKVVWQLGDSMAYGYKLQYINAEEQIISELSIYNNRYKTILLNEYTNKFTLPIYISVLLYIVKSLYYKMNILSPKQYNIIKRFILNTLMGKDDTKFLLLHNT
jgi:predicted nucleotidyltransferase